MRYLVIVTGSIEDPQHLQLDVEMLILQKRQIVVHRPGERKATMPIHKMTLTGALLFRALHRA